MSNLPALLDGLDGLAKAGGAEAALRCVRELLPARHALETARELRRRAILMQAQFVDLRADRQLARREAGEIQRLSRDLDARAQDLLADIRRFALSPSAGLSDDQVTWAAMSHQRAIEGIRIAQGAKHRAASIFVSYRRADSAEMTGFIAKRLLEEFGDGSIFMDVDSIPVGVNFRAYIVATLSKCKACLVVIGPDWLDARSTDGTRRIDDPGDLVRVEIETALRINVPVAPLLVRGALVPAKHELPDVIAELNQRNGLPIRAHPDFDMDIGRLIARLRERLGDAQLAGQPN